MVIKYTKLMLATILALSTIPLFPTFPMVEVWTDGTHFRYLLPNFSVDYVDGRLSIKQQEDIIKAAKHHESSDVFIIASDRESYPGFNKKIQELYENISNKGAHKNATEVAAWNRQVLTKIYPQRVMAASTISKLPVSPLSCLITQCKNHNVPHYNTDCRHAIMFYENRDSFSNSSKKITKQDVLDDLSRNIEEMASWPGHKKCVDACNKRLEEIKKIAGTDNDEDFILRTKSLNLLLINAKTLGKMAELQSIQHGFICQDMWHIYWIKTHLTDYGYKQIEAFGDTTIWDSCLPITKTTLSTTLQEKEKVEQEIASRILKNPLNVEKAFAQIFEEQKKQTEKANDPFMSGTESDTLFLQSSHGQEHLAETAATEMQVDFADQKKAAEVSNPFFAPMSDK